MLNKEGYTPLYLQLHDLLKEALKKLPVGSNLPPERALCEQYDLDRVTVRKALSLLQEEGLIERKQGRGTRVLRHPGEGTGGTILFVLYHGAHLVDRLGEPFYARSMDALEKRLQRLGKRLVYSKVLRDDDLTRVCRQLEAQGVIVAGTLDERMIEQCTKLNLPIVGYNTRIGEMPSVMADNEDGAALSAQHLLALGHRRFGFINVSGYINSEKRLSRFRSEIRKAGLSDDALKVIEGDWTEESGYRAAQALLCAEPRITALFGGNDSMAIGAMRAFQAQGIRVPEDLSIIGFDGNAQSALTTPPLTTLQVDVKVMAEAASMLLKHMMDGGATSGIHAVVSAEFIIRGTTAQAKI